MQTSNRSSLVSVVSAFVVGSVFAAGCVAQPAATEQPTVTPIDADLIEKIEYAESEMRRFGSEEAPAKTDAALVYRKV